MSEVVDICRKIVSIPSLSGEENAIVDELKKLYKEFGFDEVIVDKYGNILGIINGNRPGKTMLFDAHIDTVPVSDNKPWTHSPYACEIVEGRMYGRGTSDMKGSLACMIAMGKRLVSDRDFAGRVVIAGVVHEECFEGIASREISKNIKPDYVVIGEATQVQIACGQKGRAEICVETFGKSAHSANPQKGVNAVISMLKITTEIDKIPFTVHEKMGDGILALTDIKSSPYPGASVIPDYCKVTYDRRILAAETKEDVLRPFEQVITKLSEEDPNFKAKVSIAQGKEKCYTGEIIEGERFFPAWICDTEEDFVQLAKQGLKSVGIEPKTRYYAFCTNGSHYAGEAGIKTIGFGPSCEALAHVADEYVEIEDLEKVTQGFYGIVKAVLK